MIQSDLFPVRWYNSLSHRITVLFVVVLLLFITTTAVILNTTGNQLLEEESLHQCKKVGQQSANLILHKINTTIIIGKTIAGLANSNATDPQLFKQRLIDLFNSFSKDTFIHGGGVWPEQHRSEGKNPGMTGFFWARKPQGGVRFYEISDTHYQKESWYSFAKKAPDQDVHWGKLYLDPVSKARLVTASFPLYSQNKFQGVITLDLDLRAFVSSLPSLQANNQYSFIVNYDDAFLHHPKLGEPNLLPHNNLKISEIEQLSRANPSFIGLANFIKNNPSSKTAEKRIKKPKTTGENQVTKKFGQSDQQESNEISETQPVQLSSQFKKEVHALLENDLLFQQTALASIISLPQAPWRVVTVIPRPNSKLSFLLTNNSDLLKILGGVILMSVLIINLLRTSLTRPIRELGKQIEKITTNSTEKPLLKTSDLGELAALTYWFNQHTAHMLDAQSELKHAHYKLQDRVVKNSRELTQTNQKLEQEIKAHKLTENALIEKKARLSEAQSIAHIATWRWDFATNIFWWSDEAYRFCDIQPDSVKLHLDFIKLIIHPKDLSLIEETLNQSIANSTPFGAEFRIIRPSKEIRYLLSQGEIMYDEAGQKQKMMGTIVDITERKKMEAEIRLAAKSFETHEAIMITDKKARIVKVNKAFTEITGYQPEEVLGKTHSFLIPEQKSFKYYRKMRKKLLETNRFDGVIWGRRKNGNPYPQRITVTAIEDEYKEISHYLSFFSDITKQKKYESKIRHLAFYDSLTKLPNRRLLLNRLKKELAAAQRNQLFGVLLFLDLDHFKLLNDALGHHIGDELLIRVARRIIQCIRQEDTAARLGGDEFVVMLPGRSFSVEESLEHAFTVAEKILSTLRTPFDLVGHQHHITPSIGITVFPENNASPNEILKQADTAMYQAKSDGRNSICFFKPEMQEKVNTRLRIEEELREAITQGNLTLSYQPQITAEGQCNSAEALLRWVNSDNEALSLANYIAIAEESGLILPLGAWIINEACRQLNRWNNNGIKLIHLAVNVSPRQFHERDFVEKTKKAIHKHKINPRQLAIEITESVLISNLEDTIEKMKSLKKLGVKIAIDDFGTGYSSLSYLKKLPLNQLKIDQSFVHDIDKDPNSAVIVETIVAMAKHLGLNVIAEGVETEAQKQFLLQKDCQLFQGYYFSKPLTAKQFEAFLSKESVSVSE
ncbi:MAG: EAL domain-containing protein [Methylococcaceae bacterium]